MARIEFVLNGTGTVAEAPDGTPLLWVLRDVLGLTGTKYGCGRLLCGICTVHVDGTATRTCLLPFEEVAGKRVTTIEGLAALEGGVGRRLQRAWIAGAVPQCGFCQAGQLMAAAALLARTPRPSDAEIDAHLGGVLCRCATYQRIRAAIHRAAEGD